jgi:hypothetical protein
MTRRRIARFIELLEIRRFFMGAGSRSLKMRRTISRNKMIARINRRISAAKSTTQKRPVAR